jgi:hypothetical protein
MIERSFFDCIQPSSTRMGIYIANCGQCGSVFSARKVILNEVLMVKSYSHINAGPFLIFDFLASIDRSTWIN